MAVSKNNNLPDPYQLSQLFGRIDIYLLDQLLKGNIDLNGKILDAGCGGGRNLIYLSKLGVRVYGVDKDKEVIKELKTFFSQFSNTPRNHFLPAELTNLPFADKTFRTIICSAVLHFASDETHFRNMVFEMWRVLEKEGILFIRTASDIGISQYISPIPHLEGWYRLPDGTERFLATESLIKELTQELGGVCYEPIKTVQVMEMRSMTNWLLQKQL